MHALEYGRRVVAPMERYKLCVIFVLLRQIGAFYLLPCSFFEEFVNSIDAMVCEALRYMFLACSLGLRFGSLTKSPPLSGPSALLNLLMKVDDFLSVFVASCNR